MKNFVRLMFFLYFAHQIWITAQNKHRFPFCAYNMFNRVPNTKMIRPKLILKTNTGQTQVADIHETIPLEFFKAIGIYYTVFEDHSKEVQENFSKFIITTLNEKDWIAFDEVHSKVVPNDGDKFIGITVQNFELDFTNYKEDKDVSISPGTILYQYNMESK